MRFRTRGGKKEEMSRSRVFQGDISRPIHISHSCIVRSNFSGQCENIQSYRTIENTINKRNRSYYACIYVRSCSWLKRPLGHARSWPAIIGVQLGIFRVRLLLCERLRKCLREIISWGERARETRLGRTLNFDPVKRFWDVLRYLGLPSWLLRISFLAIKFPILGKYSFFFIRICFNFF